jgi:hypothetical protein
MVQVNRIARPALTTAVAALVTVSGWAFGSATARADSRVEIPSTVQGFKLDNSNDPHCNQRRYCRIQRQREMDTTLDPAVRQQDVQAIAGLLALLGVQ